MGKRKNHTDELFHSRLRQFEASPPPRAWQGIVSSLDGARRKQKAVIFRRMAASVAVLIAAGGTFLLIRQLPEQTITQQSQSVEVIEQEQAVQVMEQERHDAEPGRLQETRSNAEVMAMESGSDFETAEDTRSRKPLPAEANPGIASMTPVQGYNAVPFKNDIPEDPVLMAQVYPSVPEHSRDQGIDVFEEWGEEPGKRDNKWAVGTQVTPLYSYRSLTGAGEAASSATYFNQVESGLLAYAGGVNVHFSPRKRFAVQSGLYYSKMGMMINNAMFASNEAVFGTSSLKTNLIAVSNSSGNIRSGSDPGGGSFYAMSDNTRNETTAVVDNLSDFSNLPSAGGEVIQHFEYLELPVILRYRVIDRKLGFNVLGGLSTNFLVGRDAYFQQEGEKEFVGFTGDIKTVNYSSLVGVGLDYAVSGRLNLSFEPTFRYYLNSINEFSSLRSHPYSLGFYTGLSYSF